MSSAAWQVVGLAVAAGGLAALALWILLEHRETPEKREWKRRRTVQERGRLGDGTVTDVGPEAIYYAYAVGGVEYRASQDVTHLSEFLPADSDRWIGPVTLKYSPRNPANSIVVCEQWSGLRTASKETIANEA